MLILLLLLLLLFLIPYIAIIWTHKPVSLLDILKELLKGSGKDQ